MTGHRFDPTILREYDIRGVFGETLFPADAAALGRAFGSTLRRRGGRSVAVGYDGRISSPELEAALVEGLASTGLEVKRIGLGPTPMLYFAVFHLPADGGVMVTGSHNPADYNGFKMMLGHESVHGKAIKRLGETAAKADFETGSGSVGETPVLEAYVERIASDYRGRRDLKVGWDPGNGAAGPAVVKLVRRLPGRHRVINEQVDGTFPAHHPDPTVPKNLEQLRDLVLKERLDLGLAFDGDADRLGVIDGAGEILWGDQLMVLLSREVLSRRKGAPIIADVKASQVLFDEIARAGGEPVMWKTGHSLIKSKMAETKAPLAGEMSGHIFFADGYYGFDDGLYAAIRLLNVVANAPQSLAEMRAALPKVVNTPELRFPCPEDRKFKVVEEVRERLAAAKADVIAVDGVRVRTRDGWWLLRASNTQDVLVARCEAGDEEGLARLKRALAAELERSGVSVPV
ncbi:MAG TPA: phosphomannomutase/phosphoglucomutase [Alphaproteobacteria bacterium]|nr:phosphomannomutase/phosphoglucomutase [Alphaproteobacteria bacterium]